MIEIKNKAKCCGCGACSVICPSNAIKMQPDEKGFLYPKVDLEKCVKCGLCDKVCVHNNVNQRGVHIEKAYALQHKNKKVLSESSSGGAFTAISDYVLSQNGKVYGACLDSQTFKVQHIGTSESSKRDSMRGSKYVQSSTETAFAHIKQDLKNGILVLFSGTPCQCAALCSYLGGKHDNLILVDLLCHGVSSNMLLQEHKTYWETKKQKKAVYYKYRSKKYGYAHTHEFIFEDGERCTALQLRQLLKLYSLTMRESCYECPYASSERYGDFTIGDLWEAAEIAQIYDQRGASVVFANTAKAVAILEYIAKECRLIQIDASHIKQSALRKPFSKLENSDKFWEDYLKNGYSYVLRKYASLTMKSNIYQTMLRVLYLTKTDKIYAFIKSRINIWKEIKRK